MNQRAIINFYNNARNIRSLIDIRCISAPNCSSFNASRRSDKEMNKKLRKNKAKERKKKSWSARDLSAKEVGLQVQFNTIQIRPVNK